jgi:hypothetical protein
MHVSVFRSRRNNLPVEDQQGATVTEMWLDIAETLQCLVGKLKPTCFREVELVHIVVNKPSL